MRILIVSQMWPGPQDPDLGAFVAQVARELEGLGHDVDHAVLDRRGGAPTKYLRLAADAARRPKPDVAFAHFLVPTGLVAEVVVRAPVVVMAHGQDVANAERLAPIRTLTKQVVRRAAGVIANSEHLAGRLERLTGVRAQVIDCGVDMSRFSPEQPPADWPAGEGPRFLCVGSLTERKNVVRLAEAFERLGRGSLVYVGDGPLRAQLEGRPGIHLVGRVAHEEVPGWLAACDVLCQVSVLEPFGQAALEAMAMARSVVATREGGPPEFVTPEAGVLVDPLEVREIAAGLERAADLPSPNRAAREAANGHDARRQAERMAAVLASACAPGHHLFT